MNISGLSLFVNYDMKNLEFLSNFTASKAKIGWDKTKQEFYVDGGGFSKDDWLGWGNSLQSLSLIYNRNVYDVENKSGEVSQRIEKVIDDFKAILVNLDDALNYPKLIEKDDLITTALKLKKAYSTVATTYLGVQMIMTSFLDKADKKEIVEKLSNKSEDTYQIQEEVDRLLKKTNELLPAHERITLPKSDLMESFLEIDIYSQSLLHHGHEDQAPVSKPSSYLDIGAAVINTGYAMVLGKEIPLPAADGDEIPRVVKLRDTLKDPSTMLNQVVVHHYLGHIQSQREEKGLSKVLELTHFYCNEKLGVNEWTLEQIKKAIKEASQSPDYQKSDPVCIPVVFANYGQWERKHIATILIKDNTVEYFDPKGDTSITKALAKEGETLRDMLEYCRDEFTDAGKIIENEYPFQWDAHTCGLRSCDFMKRRLIDQEPMGQHPAQTPLDALNLFRADIFVAVKEQLEIEHANHSKKEEDRGSMDFSMSMSGLMNSSIDMSDSFSFDMIDDK